MEDLNVTVEDEKNTSVTVSLDQFHLLLQVLQSNGKPLMNGNFTGCAVAEVVHKYTGSNPIEVEGKGLERVLTQFSHEVQKVEELQKNAMAAASAHMVTASSFCHIHDRITGLH